jgi:hypothetical protein
MAMVFVGIRMKRVGIMPVVVRLDGVAKVVVVVVMIVSGALSAHRRRRMVMWVGMLVQMVVGMQMGVLVAVRGAVGVIMRVAVCMAVGMAVQMLVGMAAAHEGRSVGPVGGGAGCAIPRRRTRGRWGRRPCGARLRR